MSFSELASKLGNLAAAVQAYPMTDERWRSFAVSDLVRIESELPADSPLLADCHRYIEAQMGMSFAKADEIHNTTANFRLEWLAVDFMERQAGSFSQWRQVHEAKLD